jgi:hypothetical protein
MPRAKSKRQARLFGAIAGGKKTKARGMTRAEARRRLRGVKMSRLPVTARKKKAKARRRRKRRY